MKPKWHEIAESYIGQREIPGVESNPWIESMWNELGYGWLWKKFSDDSLLAWCGAFLALCFKKAGLAFPKEAFRAAEWLKWGIPLGTPLLGCVGVKKRKGGNHVFIPVGVSKDRKYVVGLGGNQRDGVTYAPFLIEEVTGWRWPAGVPLGDPLPVVNMNVFLNDQVKLS